MIVSKRSLMICLAGLLLALALLLLVLNKKTSTEIVPYKVPGMASITPDEAEDKLRDVLLSLLNTVYIAFSRTEETDIYDTLASATSGEALETLYLERAKAMFGNSLVEQDQTVIELRLLELISDRSGEGFLLDARWQVIGTVGHDDHMHIRANKYRADLALEPVSNAWKITGFELTGVDREAIEESAESTH